MKTKIVSFVLVFSLFLGCFIIPSSAADFEDLDLYSWLIRSAASSAETSPIVKAIEFVSGTDISSNIYKAYGYASSQICPESSDGLHEAVPSSISIDMSGSHVTYTASCKNCGLAFSSNSDRLGSAYQKYLASFDFSGSGVGSDNIPYYIWTPKMEDVVGNLYLPYLRINSSTTPYISVADSYKDYSWASGSTTVLSGFTYSSSVRLHSDSRLYPVPSTFNNFTAPVTGTYQLLDSPYLTFSGYPYSSNSSSANYPLITGSIHYKPNRINDLYTAGSSIPVNYNGLSTGDALAFNQYLKNFFSTLSVSSSSPYFLPALDAFYYFPTFKILNPVGGGTVDNSVNIGTYDNSTINYDNRTFITNGVSRPFTDIWYRGTQYVVTYEEDGSEKTAVIDFTDTGIVTTLDGTSSTTPYTGPVLPPSVDGIETNTWLQKIFNKLEDILSAIHGTGSGSGSIDEIEDEDTQSWLVNVLNFFGDIIGWAVRSLTSLAEGVLHVGGLFTGSNDAFDVFDEVMQLE